MPLTATPPTSPPAQSTIPISSSTPTPTNFIERPALTPTSHSYAPTTLYQTTLITDTTGLLPIVHVSTTATWRFVFPVTSSSSTHTPAASSFPATLSATLAASITTPTPSSIVTSSLPSSSTASSAAPTSTAPNPNDLAGQKISLLPPPPPSAWESWSFGQRTALVVFVVIAALLFMALLARFVLRCRKRRKWATAIPSFANEAENQQAMGFGKEMRGRVIALWPGRRIEGERERDSGGGIEGLERVEVGPVARTILRQDREMREVERAIGGMRGLGGFGRSETSGIGDVNMSGIEESIEMGEEDEQRVIIDDGVLGVDRRMEGEQGDKWDPFRDSREILSKY